jgi:PAS domain S-box-containing protein
MAIKKKENKTYESVEVLRAFFDLSPDGLLLIKPSGPSTEWVIVHCNKTASQMHGYDKPDDLLNKHLTLLCPDVQNLDKVNFEVHNEEKKVVTKKLMHRKRDGKELLVESVYSLIDIKEVEYLISIDSDITQYAQLQESADLYQAIVDKSPDGIVIIDPTRGLQKWPIVYCNKAFCEMNGYKRDELIGEDICFVSLVTLEEGETPEEHRKKYYDTLNKEPIKLFEEKHKRKDGTIFPIQTSSCQVTLNGRKRVLGYDRDISEKERLNQHIEDLGKDVGRTFHSVSSTLVQVKLAIKPTIKALGPDPFREGSSPTMEGIWKELASLRDILISALNNLYCLTNSSKSNSAKESLLPGDYSKIEELLSQLSKIGDLIIAEHRGPVMRKVARSAIDFMDKLQQTGIQNEQIREVKQCAERLERNACLIALRRAQDRIVDMDCLLRTLRERVITGVKRDEKPGNYEFWDMVKEAMEGLAGYAEYKGVRFEIINRPKGARVKVVWRDIVRALNNLLQNAVKYSWWRNENSVEPWIGIKGYVRRGRVYVEIQDYGVPITRDEIDEGLIFKYGFRGRLSGQLGRIGTGIGLADARDTVRRYRGDVTLNSHPAPSDSSPDDLSVPHLKTAILYLPIHQRQKNEVEHETKK